MKPSFPSPRAGNRITDVIMLAAWWRHLCLAYLHANICQLALNSVQLSMTKILYHYIFRYLIINPVKCTLCQYVPLHDPYGRVVLVVVGRCAAGMDQIPVWSGWSPLQGILTLSEQLVRVYLGQVLVWALLWVQLWLGQGWAIQWLGQSTKQPAAAAGPHWTNWWRGTKKRKCVVSKGHLWYCEPC